jgi:hypothetical protein
MYHIKSDVTVFVCHQCCDFAGEGGGQSKLPPMQHWTNLVVALCRSPGQLRV